jgi:hypothetical protein
MRASPPHVDDETSRAVRVPLSVSSDGKRISVQSVRRAAVLAQSRWFREDGVPVELIGRAVGVVDIRTGQRRRPSLPLSRAEPQTHARSVPYV